MSRWQMFSDVGNNYRWENLDKYLPINLEEKTNAALIEEPSFTPHLPSMADLLRQGFANLMDNRVEGNNSPPMFRTGLGNMVVTRQSSIWKGLSILGDNSESVTDTGQSVKRGNGCSFSKPMFKIGSDRMVNASNSMFQTASGKVVSVSSAGLARATSLLGFEENYGHETFKASEQIARQSSVNKSFGWQSASHTKTTGGMSDGDFIDDVPVPVTPDSFKSSSLISESLVAPLYNAHSAPRPPSIKFHTAGGRSISVSSDALQHAKSLLGDPEMGTYIHEGDTENPAYSFCEDRNLGDIFLNKENEPYMHPPRQTKTRSKGITKNFVSPLRSTPNKRPSSMMLGNISSGSNLIKRFDAEAHKSCSVLYKSLPHKGRTLSNRSSFAGHSSANGILEEINSPRRSSGGSLVDITNNIHMDHRHDKQSIAGKRRPGKTISISPFKRPRSSKFVTPLNGNVTLVSTGFSNLAPGESSSRRKVSSKYPIHVSRKYVKDFFGIPPFHHNSLNHLSDRVRRMNADTAEKYIFQGGSSLDCIGVEAFSHMLAQSGASMQYISKEWVANHYKWIVWKLACYERCYPAKCSGKLLTASNVFEELKYRYEREVNHGHRSAIKRILEGDAPVSSFLVLCVSSTNSNSDLTETQSTSLNGAEDCGAAKIQLTDGWYAVNALLDVPLSKELAAGKLFVGQKLRICGAGLCGWVSPVSPLEAPKTISIILHINGTYRAHWADRLGVYKGCFAPIAFRCIKGTGGAVHSTLVGVTRRYPLLYRERLRNGGFVVRSERMEAEMMQLYNQRRSAVVEGIMSEFQRGIKGLHIDKDNDSDEGAKILRILETAAEPEVLMAEMSSEQLNSFATYQAKLEAIRQSDMQKSVEKALEDAGLSGREVTPFMRVRVVGLNTKSLQQRGRVQKGLITIWRPTEKQQSELTEGQAYAVSELTPLCSASDTLYLQARGSTTKWVPLSPSVVNQYEPFFNPRKPVSLSNLGEVPLSCEFDIAAFVVYVGEVYMAAHQKKQWVFVTDSSTSQSPSKEPSMSLLAISFGSPYVECDSSVPINHNLAGSTVGFCNLIKRAKDQANHLWVADATESSMYVLNNINQHCSHLKDAAASAQIWAKISSSAIKKLREKVLSVIGDCKS